MHPHGPTDRYDPAPGTAHCPYCDQVVAGVDAPSACKMVMFSFLCPGCGREWNELRHRGGTERYYERAIAAEVTATQAPA